jgi:hypothetical protein
LTGIKLVGVPEVVEVLPAEARWITVSVQVPYESSQQAGTGAHPIHFQIERVPGEGAPSAITLSEKSTFIVPR